MISYNIVCFDYFLIYINSICIEYIHTIYLL